MSLLSAFRDRLPRLRIPRLPLPTAPLYSPLCQAAITALGVLPLFCFFLHVALLVYGVQLPISLVTLSAAAVYALCAIRFYECLARGFDRFDLSALAFMLLSVLVALRSASAASLEKLVLYLMLPALLWVMRSIPHPRVYRGVAVVLGVFLAGFYLLVAHTDVASASGVPVRNTDDVSPVLTLGYPNPNETGIYLLLVLFLVLYGAFLTRRRPELSISLLLLSLSQMHLVILTDSRTCILSAVFLYVVFLASLIPSLSALITTRTLLLCALAVPLLFFLASYFDLFNTLNISILHQSAESGRHTIYKSVFDGLSPLDFLLGDHAAHAGINQHNAYLSILSAYGLPALAAFVLLLYLYIRRGSGVYRSQPGTLSYGFLLCLTVHNSSEAAIFTFGGIYAILVSIPFALLSTHLPKPEPKDPEKKRIVLVNTLFRRGSTGMITEKLMRKAEGAGYEAVAVHRYDSGETYPNVIPASAWLDCHIHNRLARITGLGGFFSRIKTARLLQQLDCRAPDLVHLHNLHASYLHLPSLFRYLKKKRIKVVWTLHDCWPMTALCPHFSMLGCEKWKTECHDCPYVREQREPRLDLTRFLHRQKKKWLTGLPSLTLVAPSRWLAELTRESPYLSSYPVRTIYNGIDLDIFRPTESGFRERNGLVGKTVLLGVAFDWGKRKGLDVFAWLAEHLDERYAIVLVGVDEETQRSLPERILAISRTESPRELAEIYTAADLFVNPTREETLGLVNLEALACGTPGVTFAAGGSPECYDGSCGTAVPTDDNEALLREILRITETRPYTAEACVARAAAFSSESRFAEYIALYDELTQK